MTKRGFIVNVLAALVAIVFLIIAFIVVESWDFFSTMFSREKRAARGGLN